MTELICDVCGKEATVVVASRFGAVSNAYCPECLGKGIEPYSNAISLLFCVPYPDLWEGYQEIVFRSVVAAGHTMRDAAIEVTRLDRQYEEYCKRLQLNRALIPEEDEDPMGDYDNIPEAICSHGWKISQCEVCIPL